MTVRQTNQSAMTPSFPCGAEAVTLSDSTTFIPSVIYVGTGGNVKVTTELGQDVTFSNLPTGSTIPVRCTKAWSTGTTASNLVRVY